MAAMTRRSLTPRRKIEIAKRRGFRGLEGGMLSLENGKVCDLGTGQPAEFDHVYQLALGGTDDDDNLRPIPPAAHKDKSRGDAKIRAKVRRLTGANKAKPKYRWPKGRKLGIPGLRKKLDGQVVPR